jgi:hypothetical protein
MNPVVVYFIWQLYLTLASIGVCATLLACARYKEALVDRLNPLASVKNSLSASGVQSRRKLIRVIALTRCTTFLCM